MGPAPSRMIWPPDVKSIEKLGMVHDINGRMIPRDGGRSFKLGKHLFYIFGDTFCFDDKRNFVGVTNNTLAWIPNRQEPIKSSYLSSEPRVPPGIPLTPEEEAFDAEHKKENWRVMTWCFGGVVEDEPKECGKGWMWFEKVEGHGGKIAKSFGVRVCRVSVGADHMLKVERLPDEERIFPENTPQFGNISCVRDGEWIYCIGGGPKMTNVIARVKHGSDITKRSNYQFWCKDGWKDDFKEKDELQPLLGCIGNGQVVKMPGCGPGGKSFMLVCNEKWPTSKIIIGWADKITGPWEWKSMGIAPKQWERTHMRYCIFPHPWCFDWNKGELLVTYSDDGQMGGAVIALKITFAVEAPPKKDEGKEKEQEKLKEKGEHKGEHDGQHKEL